MTKPCTAKKKMVIKTTITAPGMGFGRCQISYIRGYEERCATLILLCIIHSHKVTKIKMNRYLSTYMSIQMKLLVSI